MGGGSSPAFRSPGSAVKLISHTSCCGGVITPSSSHLAPRSMEPQHKGHAAAASGGTSLSQTMRNLMGGGRGSSSNGAYEQIALSERY